MSFTKCSKKPGEYCRLHNPKGVESREKFVESGVASYKRKRMEAARAFRAANPDYVSDFERKQQERKAALRQHAIEDFDRNLKLKINPVTGETTVSIYRSGVVEAPQSRGVESSSYAAADEYTPEGRQGRMTGIFASPSAYGVTRWVSGNAMVRSPDFQVRELRVNPDQVYVYSVSSWEAASGSWGSGFNNEAFLSEKMNSYWSSGVTLTEWSARFKSDPTVDPTDWELLVSSSDIKKVSPVSLPRLLEAIPPSASHDRAEMAKEIKNNREDIRFIASR